MGITARFLRTSTRSFQIDRYSPHNLAELRVAIETEFETLQEAPDFAHSVCHILHNRCLACIAEGDFQFKHKM